MDFVKLVLLVIFLLLVHFEDLIFLVTAALVQEIVDDCYCEFQRKDMSGEQALKSYDTMKFKVKTVNSAFRNLIFFCVFGSIPFYAFNLLHILDKPKIMSFSEIAKKFNTILYFCFIAISLLIAAKANKKAGEFANWLAKDANSAKIPGPKLAVILHELAEGNIGLWGNYFFVISYQFVGSVAGILITYAILSTQLQPAKELSVSE